MSLGTSHTLQEEQILLLFIIISFCSTNVDGGSAKGRLDSRCDPMARYQDFSREGRRVLCIFRARRQRTLPYRLRLSILRRDLES